MGSHACSPIKELCILEVAVSFLVQIAAPLAAALKQNSLYIEFVHQLFAQVLYVCFVVSVCVRSDGNWELTALRDCR